MFISKGGKVEEMSKKINASTRLVDLQLLLDVKSKAVEVILFKQEILHLL